MSIYRQMNREDVAYIYIYIYIYTHTHTGILLSHKRNKFESLPINLVVRWMNLEPVIQSEVSQKEKNKYFVLMHIYGT